MLAGLDCGAEAVSMSVPLIQPDGIVRAVMDAHPETVGVFVRRRMHCPGCAMAPFITIAEAAASYAVDLEDLVHELRVAAAKAAGGRP
jgi:hybrid cluster-associated redox disulfide protein